MLKKSKFEEKTELELDKRDKEFFRYHTLALEKYKHIDFVPPQKVRDEAKRALDVRREKPASQRGGTYVGVSRARDLQNGRALSPETIRRMKSYFDRHEIDKKGEGWGTWSKGEIAWKLWGGDSGRAWVEGIVKKMDAADAKEKSLSDRHHILSDLERVSVSLGEDSLNGDWVLGKPFKTLSVGKIFSRVSPSETNANQGKPLVNEISLDILHEIVRVYKLSKDSSPVIIDFNHNSQSDTANPFASISFGEIVDMEVKDNGLWVTPMYTQEGADLVKKSGGSLWSSPEFLIGNVYDRGKDGKLLGSSQLLAVSLTPRPAQSHDTIDRITLKEEFSLMEPMQKEELMKMSPEELVAMCMQKHEMVLSLEAEKEGLKKENEDLKAEMEQLVSEEKQEPMEPAEHMYEGEKYKMSEAQANLLSEIKAQNLQLSERVKNLEAEKHQAERKLAVDSLLNSGRISPNEIQACEKAFDLKTSQPIFWAMFSERKSNSTVPFVEIGSNEKASDIPVFDQIKAIQKEKAISFSEALDIFKLNNNSQYLKHFGG